ncbi:hypothetical protein [Haladaptatus sp. DJG-WS-42]|uniref:hypothetical protein n=1 Tax=Haladaptatus sp. DJG-WS-42 TaxID=3120516 RepID=UPI0030CD54BA
MCDRHVAHLIAEYEAARLDADESGAEKPHRSDSDQTARPQPGLLAALKRRIAR